MFGGTLSPGIQWSLSVSADVFSNAARHKIPLLCSCVSLTLALYRGGGGGS